MPANVELRIASQLLQVLVPQSNTRDAAERELDVQHALDIAKILLRRFAASPQGQATQSLTHTAPSSGASRAAPVDRTQVPQSFPSPRCLACISRPSASEATSYSETIGRTWTPLNNSPASAGLVLCRLSGT